MDHKLLNKVRDGFSEKFGSFPTLVASPARINIIGEHVDYTGGLVLPAAIDFHIIGAFAANNVGKARIYAMDLDEQVEVDLNNLSPLPNGNWLNYVLGVIHELKAKGHGVKNFDLVLGGNIPIGAGVSSSAAV